MGCKTPPFPAYKEWTTARFWSFIRSNLRRAWSKWPPKYKTLNKARRPAKNKGRLKWEYRCAKCKKYFPQKEVEVDHITPVGSLSSYEELGGFVERLFAPEEQLRVVCKGCHQKITAEARMKK
jgi:ribosomal protein L44E